MDVDKVLKLFQIAEIATKFPHMSGRVQEWVKYQLLDVDKEIVQETDAIKAKIQADQDKHHRQQQEKAVNQDVKPVDEPTADAIEHDELAQPAALPRRI